MKGNMRWWVIAAYITGDALDLTRTWYQGEEADVQSEFDSALKELSVTFDWIASRNAKDLERRHLGLREIILEVERMVQDEQGRSKAKRIQCRPVGFVLLEPTQAHGRMLPGLFVLLNGCTKTGTRYVQGQAFDVALKLKDEFRTRKGVLHGYGI